MTLPTELKDHQTELHRFKVRLVVGAVFVFLLFLILGGRFFYVQVMQHEHYRTLAENNRITIVPIVPNRGLILDRNGVVLARNYSAYTLEITPSKVPDLEATIDELSKLVEITPKDRKSFKKLLDESHTFESIPIRARLNEYEVARFAANHYRFPGVEIKARLFRQYPFGETASHAIGYIGRINDSDLGRLEESGEISNYRGGDHIGKTGVEQSYEKELHGVTGFEQVETDASGRAVRTLSRTPPISGSNLFLGLDIRLQEIAEKAFGDYHGALVAIDPRNGDVLAFVSEPAFDPNLFVDGIDSANWEALNDSPDHPLTDRALRGLYPPGSTFKPFMALAALALHKRTATSAIHDPGYYMLPGSSHRYRDWKPGGHGTVDLHKAIVVSCDTYFYGVANDLGIDNIHRFMSKFNFGRKTGIDIEGELAGLVPSQKWKWRRFKQRWYPGETVITGIGQGYTLTTPLQLAYATAILAGGGVTYTPHLVRAIQDSRTDLVHNVALHRSADLSLKPEDLALVKDAMIDVNRPGGTAVVAWAGVPYTVAGKTGTAQVFGIKQNEKYVASRVAERLRDHALYIAYAPAEDPKIAVAVVVEHGSHGGSTAAPIARKVMDYYLLGKLPQDKAVPATHEEGGPHD